MLIVAGVGPGNRDYLTRLVEEKIRETEYILAFGRVGESLKDIRSDIITVNRVDEVLEYIKEAKSNLLITIDVALPKFKNVKNETKVKNIILLSTT